MKRTESERYNSILRMKIQRLAGISLKWHQQAFPKSSSISQIPSSTIPSYRIPKVCNNCLVIQIWVIVLIWKLLALLSVGGAEGTDDANFTYTIPITISMNN